jgi:hypothetical protein
MSAEVLLFIAFFVILGALGALNLKINKVFKIEATWIAVALAPVIIWLLTTDRLTEMAGFGLELKLKRAASEPIEERLKPLEPVELEADQKAGADRLEQMVRNQTPVMTLQLERLDYYRADAIEAYLDRLTGHGFFKYVVFENADRSFAGLASGEAMLGRVRAEGSAFVERIEAGDLTAWPEVVTQSVPRSGTQQDALAALRSGAEVQAVPVVDDQRRFVGVVYPDRILADILAELVARQ